MSVYKRGGVWWYRFRWNNEEVRESSKQTNKRVAEQMQNAHKTALAKGEVGIREKAKVPTLKEFAENEFRPFVAQRCADKPRTLAYYEGGIQSLLEFPALANATLDAIRQEQISSFIAKLRESGYAVSSTNRKLEVLRRMFKLAEEWERVAKRLPVVRMLPGEQRRERVLSNDEEAKYIAASVQVGSRILEAHNRALAGIRATQRGETPCTPRDPFLLHHVAIMLMDCALRPEECHRLRWDEISEGTLRIAHGKTANARRVIPLPERAAAILDMRRAAFGDSEWVFPAPTKSGHIDRCTIQKQHKAACQLAEVEYFVPYTFRHSCLTRWAEVMDPYTLAYLAGHSDFSTTRRYVHPQAESVLEAMRKAQSARGTHKNGHSLESGSPITQTEQPAIN